MPLRVGLVTCAHLHVLSYVHHMGADERAEIVGIWDHDRTRGEQFGKERGVSFIDTYEELLDCCDAVAVVSENKLHFEHALKAAKAGKHIICEKPLVTNEEEGELLIKECSERNLCLMTAFPCRFSPAWQALKQKVAAGDIGTLRAISATNRGSCPFGWFVKTEVSGGGAMIDHVVHVADLLRDLLGHDPVSVQAQTGFNMYGEEWEDTAMLTLQYPDGVFATLDSSWSRPGGYKTWGDVTMNVVGDSGTIELDMFGQEIQRYQNGPKTHTVAGYGSDLDRLLVSEFIEACLENREPLVTGQHGLAAARVALAGYRSVAQGSSVSL